MIKNLYKILFVLFVGLLMTFSGCREEIISPNNPAGNINEPVQTRSINSYSFLINAQEISSQVIEYPSLGSARTKIFISLSGDISGSARVTFFNKKAEHLFTFYMDDGFKIVSDNFSGDSPDVVEIVFQDFTGRMEIRLSRL